MVRSVHKLFKLTRTSFLDRLPKAYLDVYEKQQAPAERVHDQPPQHKYLDYAQDEDSGFIYRVPDHPIPVTFPPSSQTGLWGNVGAVVGFEKPKRLKPRIARVWHPDIEKHTFYSDILDVHLNINVTLRTLELIDKSKGFDFYILSTRVQDLKSEFGRRLKHKLLLALTRDDLSEYLREKYKEFIKPKEEAEWEALLEHEALTKFKMMRIEESIEPPLKLKFGKELIEKLKNDPEYA